MKLEDIQKVQKALMPEKIEVADRVRAVALDVKELVLDIKRLYPTAIYSDAMKGIAVSLYELAYDIEGISSCNICGDYHYIDSVPLSCQSGDGM